MYVHHDVPQLTAYRLVGYVDGPNSPSPSTVTVKDGESTHGVAR